MLTLTDPHLLPFAVAGGIMIGLVVIEGLSLLIGQSASGFLDHLVAPDGQDLDVDPNGFGSPAAWLSWINVGRVPFMILIIIALAIFSIAGLITQSIAAAALAPMPAALAAVIAFAVTVPVMRTTSKGVAKIIPRDESYDVEKDHFIGRTASVTLGPLDDGKPGLVRVIDGHGNSHSFRARAAQDHPALPQGSAVLLVEHANGVFTAISTLAHHKDS